MVHLTMRLTVSVGIGGVGTRKGAQMEKKKTFLILEEELHLTTIFFPLD